MAKRLAFVSTMESVPWGGSEELWSQAAGRLAAAGVAVSANVKRWSPRPRQVARLSAAGVAVTERRPDSVALRLRAKLGHSYHASWIRAARPDGLVVSSGDHLSGASWMAAGRAAGIPYVAVAQAAGERWWPDDATAETLAGLLTDAAAACYVSARNLELVRVQLAADLPAARVVRNPFNVPYDDPPPWPSEGGNGVRLACVGRLDAADKGQDLLIQALSRPHWRDRDLSVSLFGTGPHERALRRLTDRLDPRSVHFRGFATDVRSEVWAGHHGLVLPSRLEGLPLAVVEAMLCDRPCVVSDVAGNAELVRDGVDGFVAEAATVDAVDRALGRCWAGRGDLERMGRAAGRQARSALPADPADDFLRLIRDLLCWRPTWPPIRYRS